MLKIISIIAECFLWGMFLYLAAVLIGYLFSVLYNFRSYEWAERFGSLFCVCLLGYFCFGLYPPNFKQYITGKSSRSYSYSGGSRGSSYSGKSRSFKGGRNSGIKSGSYSGGYSSGGNILAGDTGGPGFAVQGSNYGDSVSYSTRGYSSLVKTQYCNDAPYGYYGSRFGRCYGYYDSKKLHLHGYGSGSFEYCYPPSKVNK